eukprot:GHUV01019559.1.p1 GENE.GHUV01019559.1~~GHUV01019559.1.p1  ORF type:complete len:358 (+),score=96.27 GHUV01019559.1:442-1515(+)
MSAEQQPALLLSCHFATQAFSGSLFSEGQQHKPLLCLNETLRFSLSQTTRSRAAPFASISGSRQNAPTWQPLFSLSSLTNSEVSSSELGSSEAHNGSNSGPSSSGYESSSDDSTQDYSSSELNLDKINCQLCRKPLSQPGGNGTKRGLFGRRSSKQTPSSRSSANFLVCDCCQRCYHELCCAERGVTTAEGAGGVWYHSTDCEQCQQGLQQQVLRGRCPLSDGRDWQLIDCSPISTQGQGGLKALQALKRNLGDVLEVLLPQYGPGVAQQLVDTTKGYAVLLRQEDKPVTAGLLDVYGQELAVLDVVATLMAEQGKGHCSALLGALEGWLGPGLGVASLMAVCPEDVSSESMEKLFS